MGRPSKDSPEPTAVNRLNCAFWKLLESNRLSEITVGMVSAKAQCNRGTFYYHYENINALIRSAIEAEILGDNVVPVKLFRLVTGLDVAPSDAASVARFNRLGLMMKQGGMGTVSATIKAIMLRMWEMILCPDGSAIKPETRLIIEYAAGGVLSLIAYREKSELGYTVDTLFASSFLKETAHFMLDRICETQGTTQDEIISRVVMVSQFMALPQADLPASVAQVT